MLARLLFSLLLLAGCDRGEGQAEGTANANQIERLSTPVEQTGEPTYAKKITPAEARIDWSRPGAEVDCHVRGLSPFPGAWFEGPDGTRIKALMSRVENASGEPGQVLDDTLLIACGTGAVRLIRVQREGKGAQGADEFVRGYPVAAGTVLG